MSPLSAIAVSRVAGQAAVAATRVVTQSVASFADVFAATAADSGQLAGSAIAGGAHEAENVGQAILERIRGLLAQASLPTAEPFSLELSPLDDIYVSSQNDGRGMIEAAVEGDTQLRELLSRWTSLTGQDSYRYSGRSDAHLV